MTKKDKRVSVSKPDAGELVPYDEPSYHLSSDGRHGLARRFIAEDKEFSIDALDAEIIRTEERLLRLRGQREAFSKSSGQ